MYIVAEVPGEFQISLSGCLLEKKKKHFDAKLESSQKGGGGVQYNIIQ